MSTVTDYIAEQAEPARSMLARLRDRALALVPEASEGMSYGMAALRYRDTGLVSVLALKGGGYAVYPFSSGVVALVVPALEGFASTKGGIKFTDAHPIPDAAFDALVAARREEIDAR